MAGTAWPSLAAGNKAKASEVEQKFDWLEGSVVPMLSGSTTDLTYDLGTTTARWRTVYAGSLNGTSTAGGVAIGTTSADAGALLDLAGTKALILPRLSTTQRDALTARNGMLIYNTSTAQFQKYENSSWRVMGGNSIGLVTEVNTSTTGGALATETAYSWDGSGRVIGMQFNKSATNPFACSIAIDGTSYTITSGGNGAGNYKTQFVAGTTTGEMFVNYSGTSDFKTDLGSGIYFKSSLRIYFNANAPDVNSLKLRLEHD